MSDELREIVRVEPIEWLAWDCGLAQAKTILGVYSIWPGHWRAPGASAGTPAADPFAMAQEHYESTVLSVVRRVEE